MLEESRRRSAPDLRESPEAQVGLGPIGRRESWHAIGGRIFLSFQIDV